MAKASVEISERRRRLRHSSRNSLMAESREVRGAREPNLGQGIILISLAWVSTVAAVVISPILPEMRRVFAAVPYVDVKIPLVATGPSLLVALMAVPFGILADKIGRRALLLTTLFLYGMSGTAPLWLSGLDQIVVSRLTMGLAEAAIMTTGTALIGDYFQGRTRERWLAAQAGIAPLTAVFLALIGGLLGGFGWRTPFSVYAFAFLLIPLVAVFLWEPDRREPIVQSGAPPGAVPAFSWAGPCLAAAAVVFGSIMFLVTVIQFGFLVSERGMTLPQQIGLWSAVVTVANPLGSLIFSVTRSGTAPKLIITFGLYALGFATMALSTGVAGAIIGAFIANLGGGFYLPTAITWLLSTLPRSLVGRGSGLWTAANFMGQFLSPLAVLSLVRLSGSLSHAILICAALCSVAALIAANGVRVQRSHAAVA